MTFAFKAVCVTLMVGAPLFGVWLASSLAAFANRATWLPLAAGLLLFPGLPLAWEGVGILRARRDKKAKGRRRFLTFSDRLILRTLALNLLFLVVLLAAYPSRAFVALSTRGDWMLDGQHGPTAERARKVYEGVEALTADDIAELALFCVSRPPRVNINTLEVMPVMQAPGALVVKRS